MSKQSSTLFAIAFILLLLSLSQASRPAPAGLTSGQQEATEVASSGSMDEEECGGIGEECLMRRTLMAHTDYIYTQGKKH